MGIMLAWVMLIFLPCLSCDLRSAPDAYEKVIPRILTVNASEDPVGKASYELFLHGQKQLVHLEVKRDYFVNDFPVFVYQRGILQQELPLVPDNCYFEGYLVGDPDSFISVNTCSGLRGILIKEGKSYGIEPVDPSEGLEHVLYPVAQQTQISCSSTSHDQDGESIREEAGSVQEGDRKPGSAQVQADLWSHPKYVEMFIVVSHQRFQMWHSDVSETVRKVMDIIALANSFTKGINTEVVLTGIEVWTEGNLVEVLADLQETLHNFNTWRQQKLFHRAKHDVAHLIVGHRPGGDTGQAFLNGACSGEFAAAVESFQHEDILLFSVLMVHELGHNLGMQHDHTACICQKKHSCLMHQNISKDTAFSNCSSYYYSRFLQEHKGECLFNKPQSQSRGRRQAQCGNGVREGTEECDCGNQCDSTKCCDTSCKLSAQAKCAQGKCCSSNCQIQSKGYRCRPEESDCDLPEYCDGVSAECPQDLYKLDGTMCEGMYVCSDRKCMSHGTQCRELFGSSAQRAGDDCFTKVNTLGNRFGNCGRPTSADTSYAKCSGESIFCGKVVCTTNKLPDIKEHYTVSSIWHENSYCWTIDAFTDTDIPDKGDVMEDIGCAKNKACKNFLCSPSRATSDCGIEKCHSNGVCNNLNKCHCSPGFAPPNCTNPGNGGSLDGGSPAATEPSPVNPQLPTKQPDLEDQGWNLTVLSAIILLLLLILIIIICVICFSKRGEPRPPPSEAAEVLEEEEEEEKLLLWSPGGKEIFKCGIDRSWKMTFHSREF
ncbi:disintegrin and metalloproteinase domain-containing protein 1a-like [Suncus etruscus]|uniref:disintegrin and metalloproteinase domain-containing protein 1a-like n=1 Tax=Suncus etruscus TaxID=109475 RepID=UPI00210F3EBB|nr:disintegrin and metalloproteinase domain-containing protein 1a-like [Suncus etruscus]